MARKGLQSWNGTFLLKILPSGGAQKFCHLQMAPSTNLHVYKRGILRVHKRVLCRKGTGLTCSHARSTIEHAYSAYSGAMSKTVWNGSSCAGQVPKSVPGNPPGLGSKPGGNKEDSYVPSFLLLVVRPGATSSFLLLVAMPLLSLVTI